MYETKTGEQHKSGLLANSEMWSSVLEVTVVYWKWPLFWTIEIVEVILRDSYLISDDDFSFILEVSGILLSKHS